jgi:hypothetical protein
MFVRIYEDIMLAWKNKQNRQPLLVEGARQVNKSFLLERLFAPKHFSKTLKLDFMQTPELSAIFDDGHHHQSLEMQRLPPGKHSIQIQTFYILKKLVCANKRFSR